MGCLFVCLSFKKEGGKNLINKQHYVSLHGVLEEAKKRGEKSSNKILKKRLTSGDYRVTTMIVMLSLHLGELRACLISVCDIVVVLG